MLQKLKTELKNVNTALIQLLWVKALFLPKNYDNSKIKVVLVLQGIFSETTLCLFLRTKFQVSNKILTSF